MFMLYDNKAHFQSIGSSQLFASCSEAGKAEQKERHLGAPGKMSKTGRGRKGFRITERGNGECKVQPLLSPVNLE